MTAGNTGSTTEGTVRLAGPSPRQPSWTGTTQPLGADRAAPTTQVATFSVLFVCTGNICRSALAERFGRALLDDLLGEDAGRVRSTSAGIRAVVDSAMHPLSAAVLRDFGGDENGFLARQLEGEHVRSADLVLTMTREHRRAVLEEIPRAMARTFTLREAADLSSIVGDADQPGDHLAERARAFVKEMTTARARRFAGPEDDILDPIGRPLAGHQAAGEAIVEALAPLLRRIVSLRAAQPPS